LAVGKNEFEFFIIKKENWGIKEWVIWWKKYKF
jgi:hypothetical protein